MSTGHVGTGPDEDADLEYDHAPGAENGVSPDATNSSGTACRCEYCDRPFTDADLLALHRGHAHPDRLTETQREAFRTAFEAEDAAMRRFQLRAVGAIIALYFCLLMIYALV